MIEFKKRNLIPLSLIGGGLFLLVGCIYVPYFGAPNQQGTKKGQDVELLGGTETTKRYQDQYLHKFRVGVSTRGEILREMHTPSFSTTDGSSIVYSQQRTLGYFVLPLCFFLGGQPEGDSYYVQLDFDDCGVLTGSSRVVADLRKFHQDPWLPYGRSPVPSPWP